MFVYNLVLIGFAISPAVSSSVRNLTSISTCRASEFTCLDGACIRAGAVCDTYWDCPDGSDEASCYSSTNSNLSEAKVSHDRYKRQSPCGLDQWRCTDGTCIAVGGKCDGKNDCPDRSDETTTLCGNIKPADPAVSGKCVLPPYPEHGTYVAINAAYASPGQSFDYALLNVTCEHGYGVVDAAVPSCVAGTWIVAMQKCVAFCRLYPDDSVQYYCQIPGTDGKRTCNQLEPEGTVVKAECNAPIYGSSDPQYSSLPALMTCQNDGKWNRIIKCKPECGRLSPDAEGRLFGGTEVFRGELPWHVTIYRKPTQEKNYYEQICGGSLISNRIVISAAHCYWDTGKDEKQAASKYAVAAAKLFKDWDHKDDKDAQKSELRSIDIPPFYVDSRDARKIYQHDIAVLFLETPFVYNIYVRPVCLDLLDPKFDSVQWKLGNVGKVARWVLTGENESASSVLKVLQITTVFPSDCAVNPPSPSAHHSDIFPEKSCGSYNNGTGEVCKADSGSGLSFPEIERGTTRYYLRGVASSDPRTVDQECSVGTVTFFTELYRYSKYINPIINQFSCKDGSAIPGTDLCDGNPNCPDGSDEETSACADMICPSSRFQCAYGACVDQDSKCNGINECADGSDESNELCNRQLPSNSTDTNRPQCILPPYPEHGTYVVANVPYATPGQGFPSLKLNVTCLPGYRVVGTDIVVCLDGTWSNSIPKCVRFCKLDDNPSVQFHCLVSGSIEGRRACNEYEPSGTVVSPECKPNYYSPFTLPYMRCIGGSWDNVAVCSPECGRVTPNAQGLIYRGTEAARGEVAWHVAIYRKPTQRKNSYEQICGGSLVSNRIVISAAHCFWDKAKVKKQAASKYAVAAAKLFRDWDHKDDKDAQKSELKSIEIPDRYLGVRTNYQHDIAVLILQTPVVYYTYVRPVCLDLFDSKFNDLQLQVRNFGKVAGWGLTGENGPASPVLKAVELPFVPVQTCYDITPDTFTESITGDKICAGYNDGTAAVCKGDSGGGLSFPEMERGTTRYYLRGVASTAPRVEQDCNIATVTTFTEIYQHKDYINQFIGQFRCKDGSAIPASDLCDGNPDCPDGSDEETSACAARKCPSYRFQCADGACVDQSSDCNRINECADGSGESNELCNRQLPSNSTDTNRSIQSGKCIMPPYPEHGAYVVANAPYAKPGQGFPSLNLNVTCPPGYGVVGTNIVICLDGTWSNSIPKCIRFCKLDNDPSVQFHCLVSGSIESRRACNAYEPSGTVVKPECNSPNYYSSYTLPYMRCIDGSWDNVAVCSPDCGRVNPDGMDLIIDGRPARRGELPWHVSVYRKTTIPYMQICGGTLVSNKVVISAAQCFWNAVREQQPASMFAVAIGKIYRPWDSERDVDSQKSDVKEIKIPVSIQGSAAKFQDDIAMLVLETAFMYSTFVRPVCLDFEVNFERRQLHPGHSGKVAVWELTAENGQASQFLKVVELPYVDIEQCIAASPPGFRKYITSDKICAGYGNGTALCKGDSGGGLAFPETERGTERYFLRGIVSTAANNENLCNSNTLTTFTQISKHEHFVKEYL